MIQSRVAHAFSIRFKCVFTKNDKTRLNVSITSPRTVKSTTLRALILDSIGNHGFVIQSCVLSFEDRQKRWIPFCRFIFNIKI